MLGYAKSYLRYGRPVTGVVNAEKYFRLHSSINATGTAHLRMSSQNPNQQNVSKQPGAIYGQRLARCPVESGGVWTTRTRATVAGL
jgi:DNA polymerase I-like protein with 3'-5' exonuclease and polymerase domains